MTLHAWRRRSDSSRRAIAEAIGNAIHQKFRNPNFQFDVLSRLPYSQDSAEYVAQNMRHAMKIDGKDKHLRYNIDTIGDGLVLEFGVFKGPSINWFASWLPDRTIHGFDSFEGLPEDWLGYNVSAAHFDQKGVLPKVAKNVELHKGWFDQTLPGRTVREHSNLTYFLFNCSESTRGLHTKGFLGLKCKEG